MAWKPLSSQLGVIYWDLRASYNYHVQELPGWMCEGGKKGSWKHVLSGCAQEQGMERWADMSG